MSRLAIDPIPATSDPVKLRSQITCLRQRIDDLLMFNKVPPKYLAQILADMLSILTSSQDQVETVKETAEAVNQQAYRIEQRMRMVDEPEFEHSEEYDPEYDDDEEADGKLEPSADDVVD